MTIAADFSWKVIAYDLYGNPIGKIANPRTPSVLINANGIDELSFTMGLEEEWADYINPLRTVIKVFRKVKWIDEHGVTQVYNPVNPLFAGIVAPGSEKGASNTYDVNVFSPLWRLKYRFFHDHTIYTALDNGVLLSNMLNYTNTLGTTGIVMGTTPITSSKTMDIAPFEKNIWTLIGDNLLGMDLLGFDLDPVYPHTDGDPTLMTLNTLSVKGEFRPDAYMHYAMGANNLSDLTRDYGVENLGNWVALKGAGDSTQDAPELIKVGVSQLSIDEIGLYERYGTRDEISEGSVLQSVADSEALATDDVESTVTPTLTFGLDPIYGRDYTVGDVVPIYGKKGRLDIHETQRIISCKLDLSDQNYETATPTLAKYPADLIATPGF